MRIAPFVLVFSLLFIVMAPAQTVTKYDISFENAVHHEAEVRIEYSNLENKILEVRMSRTSPGRYALHEFAKNVYGVKATDSKGNELVITRPDPHQWNVSGHDGTVIFEYTLFANRGDGTYSQIDETHAHLNMPATFAWARDYEHRPIEIQFNVREDLGWKIATQLKPLSETTFYAPDLYYFLDSPVEIADLYERSEKIGDQTIRMALHTRSTDTEVDTYFTKVMAIVNEQVEVFGELPYLDFEEYVFLNCFMPNASGDGMEHRNSTVVTNSKSLASPLGETSIGTISHEFVHTWNVERIRPASLEPFNFEESNMSGELWFAEGFTSYYTNLILARAGIRTQEEYIEGLSRGINYVFNHPGRKYFNPIEMSYQAPFVDAARSVDPVNRENTFISYYTYGSVLGLALDLSLRELDGNKNLDDFMKLMWNDFGKQEIPYTNRDIEDTLAEYAGIDFATNFFEKYIYNSQMPDYGSLLSKVGVHFGKVNPDKASLGTNISVENGIGTLRSNAIKGSPIYNAGIEATDEIISIAGKSLSRVKDVDEILKNHKPGDTIEITFRRWGELNSVKVALVNDLTYQTGIVSNINERIRDKRSDWLD